MKMRLENIPMQRSGKPPFDDGVKYSRDVIATSLIFSVIAFLACVLQLLMDISSNIVVCTVQFTFCLFMQKVGLGFADAVLIIGFVLFIYSFMPVLAETNNHHFLQKFGIKGASSIYSLTIIAFIAACGMATSLARLREPAFKPPSSDNNQVLKVASFLSSLQGSLLSICYISVSVIILIGGSEYAEGFTARTGFLLLSVALALASLNFAIALDHNVLSHPVIRSLFGRGGGRLLYILPGVPPQKFFIL